MFIRLKLNNGSLEGVDSSTDNGISIPLLFSFYLLTFTLRVIKKGSKPNTTKNSVNGILMQTSPDQRNPTNTLNSKLLNS
jgi:hypothetical protein